MILKNTLRLTAVCVLIAATTGCVVEPPRPMVVAPAPVAMQAPVYVAPTYAMPAPGFVWMFHANYGWGWRHPRYGWHRGWR